MTISRGAERGEREQEVGRNADVMIDPAERAVGPAAVHHRASTCRAESPTPASAGASPTSTVKWRRTYVDAYSAAALPLEARRQRVQQDDGRPQPTSTHSNAHIHTAFSNGSQYTKKPRSAPKYGSASPNGRQPRASTNVVQSVCGTAKQHAKDDRQRDCRAHEIPARHLFADLEVAESSRKDERHHRLPHGVQIEKREQSGGDAPTPPRSVVIAPIRVRQSATAPSASYQR